MVWNWVTNPESIAVNVTWLQLKKQVTNFPESIHEKTFCWWSTPLRLKIILRHIHNSRLLRLFTFLDHFRTESKLKIKWSLVFSPLPNQVIVNSKEIKVDVLVTDNKCTNHCLFTWKAHWKWSLLKVHYTTFLWTYKQTDRDKI